MVKNKNTQNNFFRKPIIIFNKPNTPILPQFPIFKISVYLLNLFGINIQVVINMGAKVNLITKVFAL